jgi:hypothetical protein
MPEENSRDRMKYQKKMIFRAKYMLNIYISNPFPNLRRVRVL